jgi:tetratricopeptide (TPR) repeat protein
MRSNRPLITFVLPAIIVAAGFVAVFALSGFIERSRPQMPSGYEDSDLAFNGSNLKGYACGFEGLIADFYWMRALQYVGDKVANSRDELINIDNLTNLNPRLLYPYLKTATDLDPGFLMAYNYGALVLPAIDPAKAIDLTNKGIANNPKAWRLYQHVAFIYWRMGEYEKAAEYYERGSHIEGAPQFMRIMAAAMTTQGGSRETARAMYRQMLADADPGDVQTVHTVEMRLMALDAMDEMDAIRPVLVDFKEKNGRCPNSVKEILPALQNVRLPESRDFRMDRSGNLVDPTDAPYILDKEKCDIILDLARTKLPQK